MILVSIESPFAGDTQSNIQYTYQCCLDSLSRGESPYASHLLFPQFLPDHHGPSRALGLTASDEWRKKAALLAFYVDKGFSPGMERALELAKTFGLPIAIRTLTGAPPSEEILNKIGATPDPDVIPIDPSVLIEIDWTTPPDFFQGPGE